MAQASEIGSGKSVGYAFAKKAMAELLKLADDAGPDGNLVFAGDDNHLYFQVGHRLLIARPGPGAQSGRFSACIPPSRQRRAAYIWRVNTAAPATSLSKP